MGIPGWGNEDYSKFREGFTGSSKLKPSILDRLGSLFKKKEPTPEQQADWEKQIKAMEELGYRFSQAREGWVSNENADDWSGPVLEPWADPYDIKQKKKLTMPRAPLVAKK